MRKSLIVTCFALFTNVLWGQNCECGKGIGGYADSPKYIYEFPDSSTIAFCGDIHELEADSFYHGSEFSIFACEGKEKLASYSAIHFCEVIFKNREVHLDRVIYLYNGKGVKAKKYSFARRTVVSKDKKIQISDERVILSIPSPDLVDSKSVLEKEFENMNYDQISDFLGKLEILVLNQNQKAVEILFSNELEKATNAASTEHLFHIRAVYNWTIKGNKNEKYWW